MSSLVGSHGFMALATAVAAVSGTVILIAIRLQRPLSAGVRAQFTPVLRPCISPDGRKRGKKKRVSFADDVVTTRAERVEEETRTAAAEAPRMMPANQAALYRGMLRDRSQRMSCCSY